MSGHGWGPAAPIFRVKSLRASLDHYVRVLGFEVDWEYPMIASVSRDRFCIFLCEADQSSAPVWVWIGVDDAGALCEELRARGAFIRHPPTNYHWAYEMQVADPDGHVLRIGSEPRDGDRNGEWMDASGRRWGKVGENEWKEVENA